MKFIKVLKYRPFSSGEGIRGMRPDVEDKMFIKEMKHRSLSSGEGEGG